MGIFSKIAQGLKKTRENFTNSVDSVINSFTAIDEDLMEKLEETLILADTGAAAAMSICDALRAQIKKTGTTNPQDLHCMLRDIISDILDCESSLHLDTKPSVILVIGVNGAGKTTTIGKLASKFCAQGKSVILAASDTFRAAAIEQLNIWAERAGADIVAHSPGSDPAAVLYDTLQAGKARNKDIIICDTAGRLHNKTNLMDELSKMRRVISKELPQADVETLLVLDATTGQNALNQARQFKEAAGISGIILTKLDGTAKGGVVIGIVQSLNIPVKYIGIGEKIDDLKEFNPKDFANALFFSENENIDDKKEI